MIHMQVVPIACSSEGRVLLVSSSSTDDDHLRRQLQNAGYDVEFAGVEETRWLWPMDGYEVLVVDGSARPMQSIELCRQLKSWHPSQRIMLIFGERTGAARHQMDADAVIVGRPTDLQLRWIMKLLLGSDACLNSTIAPKKLPKKAHAASF